MPNHSSWRMRTTKDGLTWEDERFVIRWSTERASWTMYDRVKREHCHELLSLGNAMEKADELRVKCHKIGLVACCKTKLEKATIAEMLYCSDLFQKAAAYCRRHYHRWFILSAKYGLVCPTQVVEPYEQTLVGAKTAEKNAWATKVVRQLTGRDLLNKLVCMYFHAGQEYVDHLLPLLNGRCYYELPMEGMGIGVQLKFYKDAADCSSVCRSGRLVEKIT